MRIIIMLIIKFSLQYKLLINNSQSDLLHLTTVNKHVI